MEMAPLTNGTKRPGRAGRVVGMMMEGARFARTWSLRRRPDSRALDRAGLATVAAGLQYCLASGEGPDSSAC